MSFERRKTRVGKVVGDKMEKTVVVQVEWRRTHRLYRKSIRMATRFNAHDESNDCRVGDLVKIIESRPLSKTKRWRVAEILSREQIADIQPEEIDAEIIATGLGAFEEAERAEASVIVEAGEPEPSAAAPEDEGIVEPDAERPEISEALVQEDVEVLESGLEAEPLTEDVDTSIESEGATGALPSAEAESPTDDADAETPEAVLEEIRQPDEPEGASVEEAEASLPPEVITPESQDLTPITTEENEEDASASGTPDSTANREDEERTSP